MNETDTANTEVEWSDNDVKLWEAQGYPRVADVGSPELAEGVVRMVERSGPADRAIIIELLERISGLSLRLADYRKDVDRIDWLSGNADSISVGGSGRAEPPVPLREWIDDYRAREADSHVALARVTRVVAANLNVES